MRKSGYIFLVIISCYFLCFLKGGFIIAIILAVWYVKSCANDMNKEYTASKHKQKTALLTQKQYCVGRPETLINLGRHDLAKQYLQTYEDYIEDLIEYGFLVLNKDIYNCLPDQYKEKYQNYFKDG